MGTYSRSSGNDVAFQQPLGVCFQVREANRQGLFTQLEAFDNRYLQKFFVGEEDEADAEDEYEVCSFPLGRRPLYFFLSCLLGVLPGFVCVYLGTVLDHVTIATMSLLSHLAT